MKRLVSILSVSFCLFAADESEGLPQELEGVEVVAAEATALEDSLSKPGLFALDPNLVGQVPLAPKEPDLAAPEILRPRYKNPLLSVGLSSLFPGLGHFYLGDMSTGSRLAGSASLSVGALVVSSAEKTVLAAALAYQTAFCYGLYAAYRDTQIYNGMLGLYKMPTDDFSALAYAPLQLRVLKKPEVWGGVLGTLTAAIGMTYLVYKDGKHHERHRSDEGHRSGAVFDEEEFQGEFSTYAASKNFPYASPIVALPIGIAEEALFRGFLQSVFCQDLPPWGGIALSSILFGAAHIPNALYLDKSEQKRYYAFSIPFITGMGAYLGWLTHKNSSLQESVAVHTWYDFALFSAVASARSHKHKGRKFAAALGQPQFALSFSF